MTTRQLRTVSLIFGFGLLAVCGCQSAAKRAALDAQARQLPSDADRPMRPSESDEPHVATAHRTHPWVRDPREAISLTPWMRSASFTGSC